MSAKHTPCVVVLSRTNVDTMRAIVDGGLRGRQEQAAVSASGLGEGVRRSEHKADRDRPEKRTCETESDGPALHSDTNSSDAGTLCHPPTAVRMQVQTSVSGDLDFVVSEGGGDEECQGVNTADEEAYRCEYWPEGRDPVFKNRSLDCRKLATTMGEESRLPAQALARVDGHGARRDSV